MADLTLNVTIKNLNVPVAAPAFLRKCPIPKIEDPENSEEMINEFDSTKKWVEEYLRRVVLRVVNHGIDLQALDYAERLTKDIFLV